MENFSYRRLSKSIVKCRLLSTSRIIDRRENVRRKIPSNAQLSQFYHNITHTASTPGNWPFVIGRSMRRRLPARARRAAPNHQVAPHERLRSVTSRVSGSSPRYLGSGRVPGADRECGNRTRRHDPRIGGADRKTVPYASAWPAGTTNLAIPAPAARRFLQSTRPDNL